MREGNNTVCLIKCPYYKTEGAATITCEGIQNSKAIQIQFNSRQDKIEHMGCNCFFFPNDCEIYLANEDKY